jgi:hypothetical protein
MTNLENDLEYWGRRDKIEQILLDEAPVWDNDQGWTIMSVNDAATVINQLLDEDDKLNI